MEASTSRQQPRSVPVTAVAAFVLAVLAGICAGVSLLIVAASGISGFYTTGEIVIFLASLAAMAALLITSTAVGVAALRHRGPLPRWNRTYLVRGLALVVALAGSVAATLLDLGGDAVALIVDVSAVALLVNAVRWDVAIWRGLNAPSEGI